MGKREKDALELAARALCRHDGHPEDIRFEGRPMWQSYRGAAAAVLMAIDCPADPAAGEGETGRLRRAARS